MKTKPITENCRYKDGRIMYKKSELYTGTMMINETIYEELKKIEFCHGITRNELLTEIYLDFIDKQNFYENYLSEKGTIAELKHISFKIPKDLIWAILSYKTRKDNRLGNIRYLTNAIPFILTTLRKKYEVKQG